MSRNAALQFAEVEIEGVRLSGARRLILQGRLDGATTKLLEVPESVGQLTHLESLDLSFNNLSSLPNSVRRLTELRELTLAHNVFRELPESIRELRQLQRLWVDFNPLIELPHWIGELTELRELYISGVALKFLPVSFASLRQLRKLYLNSTPITVLPDCLFTLPELRELHIGSNNLRSLPQSIGKLLKLERLGCFDNELNSLPLSLGDLVNLQTLQLGKNQFREIPTVLKQLPLLKELHVHQNAISLLPKWIDQLESLEDLNVHANQLTDLPDQLGNLAHLKGLHLGRAFGGNPLRKLPSCIARLRSLEELSLGGCELTSLPDWLGELGSLRILALGNAPKGNPLGEIPSCVRRMITLEYLNVSRCSVTTVPKWLSELPKLQTLDLSNNLIQDIPASLSEYVGSWQLNLHGNPLNPELSAAYDQGAEAMKRYLRELAKGRRKRYEAKLLILGDGNEGKTCVSRAIRGLPFQPQVTTRGVDVERWKFQHPDHTGEDNEEITLNIWDFEGQEINHQTHQFFLATQALYLLVFRCRDQFLLDRAEYWLDTIRARAPKAKVAIVVTQCEERTPYVPQDKLQAQYEDLLAEGKWLFAVGCGDNSGVVELQHFLQRSAADLEFMGREWPESYSKAEEAIKDKAKDGTPHVSRGELYDIFERCNIDKSSFKDVAGAMSILGVMTQFPDCPDLRDFIVLQPQWLTKAISEVMEDKQLASDKGEISLDRMEDIWERRAYPGMFPTFHDCMKEFELCYDLEDASRSCLVPLRFGYQKPRIPWSPSEGVKERRVEYKLNIRPPAGLMSRFIVKTHHMTATTDDHPKGVYWHNGVFLRTGAGSLASEALCEFDSDARKLSIQVQAAFPQNLLEQVHGYVKAVFSFFGGLEAQRSYGCIKIDESKRAEEKCRGVHTENRIYSAIRKQRVLDCEYEFHDVDPQKLIWGFSTFGEYVMAKVASIEELREELDKKPEWAVNLTQDIGKLLGWVIEHRGKVNQLVEDQVKLLPEIKQQLELKLHEYLAYTSQMLDDRDFTSAPGLISLSTKDRSKWNPTSYFKKTYVLTPFCECDRNIHPCEDGQIEFTKDQQWWENAAPWIARGSKVLAAGLQLAFAGMPLVLGKEVFEAIKNDVKFMGELTKHMELKTHSKEDVGEKDLLESEAGKELRGPERESRLMRLSLARFLEEIAPTHYRARQWGSLRRVRMSDNSHRWVCESCTNELKG